MTPAIDQIRSEFQQSLQAASTSVDVEALRVKYLGKKGPVQDLMKRLRDASSEERPLWGKWINDLKLVIEEQLKQQSEKLLQDEEVLQLAQERLDITLPGRRRYTGRPHVITQALDEMIDILMGLGFSVQYGPDVDTDYYNFEALNFPPDHPARDMQDTFYINPKVLLRTHTSNTQARIMEGNRPPIRVIAPGKVYRNESITARSHVFFHQIEGFYIDEHVTFADLLATFQIFLQKLFKSDVAVRYRPSYFPFVEPGVEVDVSCVACQGKGCSLCKHTGWLEVAGAGMIHPEVLKNGGIDPEKYTGYAWGMGVERLTILRKGIRDIRSFTENDLRFLSQFNATA